MRSKKNSLARRGLVGTVAVFGLVLFIGIGWALTAFDVPIAQLLPSSFTLGGDASGDLDLRSEDPIDLTTRQYANQGAAVGYARHVGEDLVSLNGNTYRLWGIRAYGGATICGSNPLGLGCGTDSYGAVDAVMGSHLTACFDHGTGSDGRAVGQCLVGHTDLAGVLVENGLADIRREETSQYGVKREMARTQRRGIWRDR